MGPSSSMVSGEAHYDQLKISLTEAYRPGMSRLNSIVPPNPRLQRTRSAALAVEPQSVRRSCHR